jgi:HK97 family phage prohead protease
MHPEALKKLSEEVRSKIEKAVGAAGMQETISKTRAANAEDTGTFEVIISTDAVDRQGEIVDQSGWDLTFYKMNPVVLWAHDYYSMPIGVCDEIGLQNGKLVAKGRFAPAEANPFAQQVRALYDAGMLRTTSVGFIVHEADGEKITKAELLEFSFVPVPANPLALSLRQMKELGIEQSIFAAKGINVDIKADPKEGDTCTLEDGTEGSLAMDGDQMVCKPKQTTEGEKTKGAVQDELDTEEAYEQKWKNLDVVCEAINAFFDVYLTNETKPEQFGDLLKELAGILVQIADGAVPADDGSVKSKMKTAKEFINRKTVDGEEKPKEEEVINGENANDNGASSGGNEPGKTDDDQSAKQRSNVAGSDTLDALKKYNEEKAVLREIATIVGDALGKINAKDRSSRKK